MVITEADLRDQVRRPTLGAEVIVPAGARLSPSAEDFVKQWKLNLVAGVAVGDKPNTTGGASPAGELPTFQKESVFPVDKTGPRPRCTCCGTEVSQKGDALTQLNAHHYVVKNHPRIRLRGQVDSLHAQVLMAEHQAYALGLDWLGTDLATLAAYCRELTSAEYNERPVADLALIGWSMEQIHKATHDPQGVMGVPHATIDGRSSLLLHWLNICRTQCREVELTAMDAFSSPHHPFGASINHGLNRLSSAFYFLQLRLTQHEQGITPERAS